MGRLRKTAWVLLGLALLGAGCSREDTERLAKVGRRVAASAESLGADCRDALGGRWDGLCAVADHAGVEARVAARLRWDKGLAGSAIKVQASGGTVELKGTVRSLAQRRRAVDLAESTAGAEQVSDDLQVSER